MSLGYTVSVRRCKPVRGKSSLRAMVPRGCYTPGIARGARGPAGAGRPGLRRVGPQLPNCYCGARGRWRYRPGAAGVPLG